MHFFLTRLGVFTPHPVGFRSMFMLWTGGGGSVGLNSGDDWIIRWRRRRGR